MTNNLQEQTPILVEAVARAIYTARWVGPCPTYESVGYDANEFYQRLARAAIQAVEGLNSSQIMGAPPEPQPNTGGGGTSYTGRVHDIKTWPIAFRAVRDGLKPWELRKNDRDFKVGDLLCLHEFNPDADVYTGQRLTQQVRWILDGGFGLPKGYIIMTLDQPFLPNPSTPESAETVTEKSDPAWRDVEPDKWPQHFPHDAYNDPACRKAFESYAWNHIFSIDRGGLGTDYVSDTTEKAWYAWCACWQDRAPLTLPIQSTPVGWKLVPIEPTEGMLCAAWDTDNGLAKWAYKNKGATATAYKAMLNASPVTPEVGR